MDKTPHSLFCESFSRDKLPEVAGFECGNKPYESELADWITADCQGDNAVTWIGKGSTQVWLFKNSVGELVGYGSLGQTDWRWPPPNGPKKQVAILPAVAIQKRFQGKPDVAERSLKYSSQIMAHILAEVSELSVEILALFVHKDNIKAIKWYEKIGFLNLDDRPDADGYRKMYLNLEQT